MRERYPVKRLSGCRCIRCIVQGAPYTMAVGDKGRKMQAIRYNARTERGGPDRRKRTRQDRECRVDHLDDHDKKSAHAFCVSSVLLRYYANCATLSGFVRCDLNYFKLREI